MSSDNPNPAPSTIAALLDAPAPLPAIPVRAGRRAHPTTPLQSGARSVISRHFGQASQTGAAGPAAYRRLLESA
jgi:hypothetical protein